MIPQPGTSGDWTVYMTGDETPRIDEVNSVQICVTRCTNQGFYDITIVIVFLSFYLYKYQQKLKVLLTWSHSIYKERRASQKCCFFLEQKII